MGAVMLSRCHKGLVSLVFTLFLRHWRTIRPLWRCWCWRTTVIWSTLNFSAFYQNGAIILVIWSSLDVQHRRGITACLPHPPPIPFHHSWFLMLQIVARKRVPFFAISCTNSKLLRWQAVYSNSRHCHLPVQANLLLHLGVPLTSATRY